MTATTKAHVFRPGMIAIAPGHAGGFRYCHVDACKIEQDGDSFRTILTLSMGGLAFKRPAAVCEPAESWRTVGAEVR